MEKKKKILEQLFGIAGQILNIWEKIPKTKILNQESTINVQGSYVDYSIAIRIPSSLRTFRKPIPIPIKTLLRVSVSSLSPMPRSLPSVVQRSLSGDGFVLFPERIPSDVEIISMSASYPITRASVMDDFVETKKTHDPGGEDRNEYWYSALLKHPKILKDDFGRFDVRDVDVTIDVSVQEELGISIPGSFKHRLKTFFELFYETDPRQQWKAIPKLRSLSRAPTAGKEMKILNDLRALFVPIRFSKFIEIRNDFRYSTCYSGKESFELPIDVIPKTMQVVSRADLTLEKPAADGVLIYKKDLFQEALEKLF